MNYKEYYFENSDISNVSKRVINNVCSKLNVSQGELLSETRKREVVEARYIAMMLLNSNGIPHGFIGRFLNRHRTTVIYAVKTGLTLIKYDKKFNEKYELCNIN